MKTKRTYERWDKKNGLKGITIYLEPAHKKLLKKVAAAADKSVTLYVRRLVENHLRDSGPPPTL